MTLEPQIPVPAQISGSRQWQKPVGRVLYAVGWLLAVFDFCAVVNWGAVNFLAQQSRTPPDEWPKVWLLVLQAMARTQVLAMDISMGSLLMTVCAGALVYSGRRLMRSSPRRSIRDTLLVVLLFHIIIVAAVAVIVVSFLATGGQL